MAPAVDFHNEAQYRDGANGAMQATKGEERATRVLMRVQRRAAMTSGGAARQIGLEESPGARRGGRWTTQEVTSVVLPEGAAFCARRVVAGKF